MFCAGSSGSSTYVSAAIFGVSPISPILPFGETAAASPSLSTAMTARMSSAGMLKIFAARSISSGGVSLARTHHLVVAVPPASFASVFCDSLVCCASGAVAAEGLPLELGIRDSRNRSTTIVVPTKNQRYDRLISSRGLADVFGLRAFTGVGVGGGGGGGGGGRGP